MTGTEIEYGLGLYFVIASLSFKDGKFTADAIKLIAGILLLILAFLGIAFVKT